MVTIDEINEILPQTQCQRCGYPSCRDYATALYNNEADINQCPPGKEEGIIRLAKLLDKEVIPLNPKHGVIKDREIALIDEEKCIGCVLCIKACPVDAIIGSNKFMHTVIATECTGCELCIPACPVDCIVMVPMEMVPMEMVPMINESDEKSDWTDREKKHALWRYNNRLQRISNEKKEREERLNQVSLFPHDK